MKRARKGGGKLKETKTQSRRWGSEGIRRCALGPHGAESDGMDELANSEQVGLSL